MKLLELDSIKMWIRNQGLNNVIIISFFATILIYLQKRIGFSIAIFLLIVASAVLASYLGSLTAFVLVGIISMLSLSTVISISRILYDGSIAVKIMIFLLFPIFFSVFFVFKKFIVFEYKWGSELLALSLALTSLILIWDPRLSSNGGAIASLYASEDNAAWILNTHRVIQSQGFSGAGDYGALMDSMLLISHNISETLFVDLTKMDHLALSVVLLQILFIFALPFVSSLASLGKSSNPKSVSSTFVLAIALLLGFRTLNSIGHLSAAIAFIFISCFLILGFESSEADSRAPGQSIFVSYVQVLLAYMAGITWFPIAPLSILLIAFTFWRANVAISGLSRVYRVISVMLCLTLITLLSFQELIRRFSFFQESGGIAGGATNLLGMEGGTISAEPLNISLVAILATILACTLALINQKSNLSLFAFAVLLVYVFVIKSCNALLFSGQVNYGSRKLELVAVLCGAAFLSWSLVRIFEIHFHRFVSPMFIGLFVSLLFFSMSATNSILGGKYFAGFDSESNLKVAVKISKNIEVGKSAICINETYQVEPMSELRLAAYSCSRWVSAYSFTDDSAKNEWRKAVLAAIPREQFSAVRDSLPTDTKLLIVAPNTEASISPNPEWEDLVSSSWEIVR